MLNQLPTVYKALSGEDGKPGGAGAKKKAAPAAAGAKRERTDPEVRRAAAAADTAASASRGLPRCHAHAGRRLRAQCYEKPSPGRILSPKDNLNLLQGATIEVRAHRRLLPCHPAGGRRGTPLTRPFRRSAAAVLAGRRAVVPRRDPVAQPARAQRQGASHCCFARERPSFRQPSDPMPACAPSVTPPLQVLYSTGDVENLQLDEVINDGHLTVVRV